MSAFTITRDTPLSVAQAWAAVADLGAHGDVVPLTRLVLDPGPTIWDHMLVTKWSPPGPDVPRGALHIVKTGQWLGGWAHITIEAAGAGARVEWTEEIYPQVDPVPRLTAPLARRLGSRLFTATLEALLRRAETSARV